MTKYASVHLSMRLSVLFHDLRILFCVSFLFFLLIYVASFVGILLSSGWVDAFVGASPVSGSVSVKLWACGLGMVRVFGLGGVCASGFVALGVCGFGVSLVYFYRVGRSRHGFGWLAG